MLDMTVIQVPNNFLVYLSFQFSNNFILLADTSYTIPFGKKIPFIYILNQQSRDRVQ